MKKKNPSQKKSKGKLSLDRETIKKLNEEQLSEEEAGEIGGGFATKFTGGPSCCADNTYTSCGS